MPYNGVFLAHLSSSEFDPQDRRAFGPLWTWLTQQNLPEHHLIHLRERVGEALELSVDRRLTDWRAAVDELSGLACEFQHREKDGQALSLGAKELCLVGNWIDMPNTIDQLQRLHPWRKGPIRLGDILIDIGRYGCPYRPIWAIFLIDRILIFVA